MISQDDISQIDDFTKINQSLSKSILQSHSKHGFESCDSLVYSLERSCISRIGLIQFFVSTIFEFLSKFDWSMEAFVSKQVITNTLKKPINIEMEIQHVVSKFILKEAKF